jgi:hypothetical protein
VKRLTVFALALTALLGWGSTRTFGIAQLYLQPRTTTAPIGAHFTLQANIRSNVTGVYAWQTCLDWNVSILRCDSTTEGPFLKRGAYSTYFIPNTSSGGWVGCTLLGQEPPNSGDGTLCYYSFTVIGAGACSLRWEPADCMLLDTNIANIPMTVENGYFQIPSGVEENTAVGGKSLCVSINAVPNPFASYASVPGHAGERFTLYDVGGRQVGTCRGDRIGEGLAPGVYFLRPEGRDGKPTRVVKIR